MVIIKMLTRCQGTCVQKPEAIREDKDRLTETRTAEKITHLPEKGQERTFSGIKPGLHILRKKEKMIRKP